METRLWQDKPLSVKEIESAKPKEADYVLYDGDGLELFIKSSGNKIWLEPPVMT